MKNIYRPLLHIIMAGCMIFPAACQSKKTIPPNSSLNKSHVYYVAANGSESNPGSKEAPLLLINTAINKALPGDTIILRGGKYQQKLQVSVSGTGDKKITIKAYPNELPILDGTGLSISGAEALVTIRNAGFIVMEGIDICNYKTTQSWVDINGVIVDGSSHDITIRNNKIYNIENNASPENGRSGHGILVIGNTGVALRNITVEGNEIHDCNTGYSENLTINGYVDGFLIKGNKIYNGENIGIVAAGGYAANAVPSLNFARNGVISGNEIFNIDGTTGPIPAYSKNHGAISIYVDGARNITVDGNNIHNNDRGIGIVSENNDFPTKDCIVRNNFVYNCWLTGICLGGYIGYTGGGTYNCYVVNNTLFQNNKTKGYFNETEGEIRLTVNCYNNIIQNNIIYGRQGDVYIHKYTTDGSGNTFSHNFYYTEDNTSGWIWNGVAYNNFSDWQKACGSDTASVSGINPLLKNTTLPDLHILPGSPAKNNGLFISAEVNGATDIDGQSRLTNSKICKGADQIP